MQCNGFARKMISGDLKKNIFFNPKGGDPLVQKKRFLLCRGVIFQKKKVFGSLSNMSKNGLRILVSQNFDITNLSY